MEIFFSHDKSSMGNYPRITPSPQSPSPNKKIPLKASVHFPITITMCKQRSKCVTRSPSHGDCLGVRRPKNIFFRFLTMLNEMVIAEFWSGDFWKNIRVGRVTFLSDQFLGYLKRALELLISVRMNPRTTFLDQWIDTITPEKKNKKK